MGWFVVGLILLLVAVVGRFAYALMKKSNNYSDEFYAIAPWVVRGVAGLAVFIILINCFVIVPVKQLGVVTELGIPTRSYGNGPHLVHPWADITLIDAALQTDFNVEGGNADDETPESGPCVPVRIGNGSIACVDTTTRWRTSDGGGTRLYQDFKEFNNIRKSLVTTTRASVLNDVMSTFDPIGKEDPTTGKKTEPETLEELSFRAVTEFKRRTVGLLEVNAGTKEEPGDGLVISLIHFHPDTQKKIDDYQAEVAQTRIAVQAKQTALAQAEANKALADSVSRDPNVLVAKCWDNEKAMIDKGMAVPSGRFCWMFGQNTNLLVGAGR